MAKLLTDVELRAHWLASGADRIDIEEGTILSPAARDYIREQGIEIRWIQPQRNPSQKMDTMTRVAVPTIAGKPYFVDERTGRMMFEKPEEMTHLHTNVLVPKTDPRIEFRGHLDCLMAEIVRIQCQLQVWKEDGLADRLEEILGYVQKILSAEVREAPLEEIDLLGRNSAQLRYDSQNPVKSVGIDHPIPGRRLGLCCSLLNELRADIRTAELSAARAFFKDGTCTRTDIIEGLNRLSSAVYLLFCMAAAGKTGGNAAGTGAFDIPVEASARHVHLTKASVEKLFGPGAVMGSRRPLSQPGQFLSDMKVDLVTEKGRINGVSVLGPERSRDQVELSLTDARVLGLKVPIRLSGDLDGSCDLRIEGPRGAVDARSCAIAAKAHIHMTPEDARKYGVSDGETVSLELDGKRPVVLSGVVIRVTDTSALAAHIDYDEFNAAGLEGNTFGRLIRRK